jgi:uncharacterized protein
MTPCFFTSDLHGRVPRYQALLRAVRAERPRAVFLGGDLFPHELAPQPSLPRGARGFLDGVLVPMLRRLREDLAEDYPRWFVILGNDDLRSHEAAILQYAVEGLWTYVHQRVVPFATWKVCGYAMIPPSPFRSKDFERFDVSRHVDPGCIAPEDGVLSIAVSERELRMRTIADDLEMLARLGVDERTICLFHCPPYRTRLDRAALDGKSIDHAPLDVHIGSIAVRRFFESHALLVGLHGHVHEAARITGDWRDHIGETPILTGAHDGPELALVRFAPEDPAGATRELVATD